MGLKYVILDNLGMFGTNDGFIIFPAFEEHKSVANKYGGIEHVISAGFVSITHDCKQDSFVAHCYGKSQSLHIGSRELDSRIITFYFNNQNE